MAVTVKKIVLWRSEISNRPGVLAEAIAPLANTGADLKVLMGYRYPGEGGQAAVELYPVAGKKTVAAAQAAGLSASSIPTLLVEGDNKPGVAHAIAAALGRSGINIGFFVAQTIGRKYTAVLGFETDDDARQASSLIKKATASKKK